MIPIWPIAEADPGGVSALMALVSFLLVVGLVACCWVLFRR